MIDFDGLEMIILDVDGVLTDGTVRLTSDGEVDKGFHVHDGWAIKTWQKVNGAVALLSGRESTAVATRAAELGLTTVRMGESDKLIGFREIIATSNSLSPRNVIYVGDDMPDLTAMAQSGFPVAVSNAAGAVKRAAAYVTRTPGGQGAVAEVAEFVLRKQGRWSRAFSINGVPCTG